MDLVIQSNIIPALIICFIIKTLIDSMKLYIPGKKFIFFANVVLSIFCVLSFDLVIFNCKYIICSYALTAAFITSGTKSIHDLLDLIGANNTKANHTSNIKIDSDNIVWMGNNDK